MSCRSRPALPSFLPDNFSRDGVFPMDQRYGSARAARMVVRARTNAKSPRESTMYTASFGLRANPFEDRADSAYFHPSPTHEEALAAMQYEVQHGTGIGLLLGDAGTGKTMVVRALTRRLTGGEKVVVLSIPGNGVSDVLRETCKGFGVSVPSTLHDARGLARLQRHLARCVQAGNTPVLIIDQAENLTPGDLADIESLFDTTSERGRMLRLILAAHPRFRSLLAQPAFDRLRQLAFTQQELAPLGRDELDKYIQHRLHVAGAEGREIFSPQALDAIAHLSNGVPRVINQACSAAMLAAYAAGRSRVDAVDIGAQAPDLVQAPSTMDESRAKVEKWLEVPDPEQGDDPSGVDPTYSRLSTLVQQATDVVETLSRKTPQASHSVQQVERDLQRLVSTAREQIGGLESRLAATLRRSEQAAAAADRLPQILSRAEKLESRLTALTEQLTEQIDQVQSRVTEIVQYAAPLDDARTRLDGALREAAGVASHLQETLEHAAERITEQAEGTLAAVRRSAASIAETATEELRKKTESIKRECKTAADQAGRLTKASIESVQQALLDAVKKSQDRAESIERTIEEKCALIEKRASEASSALAARQKSALEEIERKADDARRELSREAHERTQALQDEGAQAVATVLLKSESAKAAGEGLSALIAGADAKVSQLTSLQAAATHLVERLARAIQSGHPLVERVERSLPQLDDRINAAQKSDADLAENISKVRDECERITLATASAAAESQKLNELLPAATELAGQLASLHPQAGCEREKLEAMLARAADCVPQIERLGNATRTAEQMTGTLSEIVATATAASDCLPGLIEQADQKEAALNSAAGMAVQQCNDAQRQMAAHLHEFQQTLHASEATLRMVKEHMKSLDGEFHEISAKAEAAQQSAHTIQNAVANAQTQTEHLERVTVAVRKVFAGLSQATLSARNQTQELEQFVAHANEVACTVKGWLDGIRRQLNSVIGVDRPFSGSPELTRARPTAAATLEREAQLRIEDEPGARAAHLVEGGLESPRKAPLSSPAQEIAELIEDARQARSGEKPTQAAAR